MHDQVLDSLLTISFADATRAAPRGLAAIAPAARAGGACNAVFASQVQDSQLLSFDSRGRCLLQGLPGWQLRISFRIKGSPNLMHDQVMNLLLLILCSCWRCCRRSCQRGGSKHGLWLRPLVHPSWALRERGS